MRSLKKIAALFVVFAMICTLFVVPAYAASNVTLRVALDTTSVKTGGIATLNVYLEGNDNTVDFSMMNYEIAFDPAVFEAKDVTDQSPVKNDCFVNNTSKVIGVLSLNPGTASKGTAIQTVELKALKTVENKEDFTFELSYVQIVDPTGADYTVDSSSKATLSIVPSFQAKSAEVAAQSFDIGTDVAAELANLTATVKGDAGKEASGYAIENIVAPDGFDNTKPGAYKFKAVVVPDETKPASWTGDLNVEIDVTLNALTDGTVSVSAAALNVMENSDKSALDLEAIKTKIVEANKGVVAIKSGVIEDVYEITAADISFPAGTELKEAGNSANATITVTGASKDGKFNLAAAKTAEVVVTVDPAEIVSTEDDFVKVEFPDSITVDDDYITANVKRSDNRKNEPGVIKIKVTVFDKDGSVKKTVDVDAGAFEADATSLEIKIKASDIGLSDLSTDNKLGFGITYDGAAAYNDSNKTDAIVAIANASSGVKPSGVPSGGSTPTKKQYEITIEKSENGSITAVAKAARGDKVTVTVTPDKGYKLDKIVVTTTAGTNIPVTDKSFEMPDSAVKVAATFVEGEEDPDPVDPGKSEFTDLTSSHWAYEAVNTLKGWGIINGVTATTFEPDSNVTRAQFTKMIAVMFGLKASGTTSKFADCGADDWFTPFVIAASEAGYVNGVDEKHFAPDEQISRQDICTILGRILDVDEAAAEAGFTDADEISDYAVKYVKSFVALGVVNGYPEGTFRPEASATRAEAAKVLFSVSKLDNEKVKSAIAALKGE